VKELYMYVLLYSKALGTLWFSPIDAVTLVRILEDIKINF